MKNLNLRSAITRGAVCMGIATALTIVSTGAAFASTPTETPTPTSSVGSTTGFDYVNSSSETFTYVSKTGRVGAPPATFTPGQVQSLQVPYNFIHDYDSSVTWDISNFQGTQIGTMVADVNNAGESSLHLYNMSGGQLTSMTWTVMNDLVWLEDAKGSAGANVTYAAGSADEQAAISNLCANNESECTFTPNANSKPEVTYSTTPTQLAAEYNPTGDQGSVEAGKSESYAVTDSWGVTATAQWTIKALQAGIQASYGKSVTATTTWETSSTQPVPPKSTTFIWGFAPVISYEGTWTIHDENTTFTAPGVTYSVGDSSRPILYVPVTTAGDTTNNPQPPSLDQALQYAATENGGQR